MTVRMASTFLDSDPIHNNNNHHHQNSPGSSDSTSPGGSSSALIHQAYNWYYDKNELKRTPSIIDGIAYERERRYRNDGARFILNVGSEMKLRYTTLATGVVYYHRFYMFHSFKVFPRYVTAACCLFLAGKAEETPKKCKDIIRIAKTMLTETQYGTFGEDPKEEVLTMERIVLQTIRFDLQVDHPYKFLINYAKGFKGSKDKINGVLQMAWTFTNDSLGTTICLQWEPEIVAIAMIFLASKIKCEITDWEGRLPSQKHWWDIYVHDLSVEMLEDVCHQVLDLYQKPRNDEPRDSPPMSPVAGPGQRLPQMPHSQPPNQAPPPPPVGLQPPPPPPGNALPIPNHSLAPPSLLPVGLPLIPPNSMSLSLITPAALAAAAVANGAKPPTQGSLPPPPAPPIPPQWDPTLASFYNLPGPFPFPGSNMSVGGPPVPPHLLPGMPVPPPPGMLPHVLPPPPMPHTAGLIPPPPQRPLPPTMAAFVAAQRKQFE